MFPFHRKSKASTTTSSNSANVPSKPPRQACNVLRWLRKARNALRRLRQACKVLRGLRRLNIYHLDIEGAGSDRTVSADIEDTTSPGRIFTSQGNCARPLRYCLGLRRDQLIRSRGPHNLFKSYQTMRGYYRY